MIPSIPKPKQSPRAEQLGIQYCPESFRHNSLPPVVTDVPSSLYFANTEI
jgi:hypothetical protein